MYKSLILLCAVYLVITEARPKWQYLPEVPGYVPVYIRNGDTPLEEINPDLAEAFHALPAGRSAGKHLDAAPETPANPEPTDDHQPDAPVILESDDIRADENLVEKSEMSSEVVIQSDERR